MGLHVLVVQERREGVEPHHTGLTSVGIIINDNQEMFQREQTYQKYDIEDRETFQNVWEGRFQVQMFVGKYKETEDIPWNKITVLRNIDEYIVFHKYEVESS